MSKAFDTINIHTLIRMLLQTNIQDTPIKFIANYIKGRKAYTTYRKSHILTTSIQNWRSTRWRPFTNTIQHIYCRHSTTKSTSASNKYIQPYINKAFAWTKQNNLHSVHFRPAEYKSNLYLKINNTALRMAMHPKVLGLTLDPKLTYSTHIHNISVQAHQATTNDKSTHSNRMG